MPDSFARIGSVSLRRTMSCLRFLLSVVMAASFVAPALAQREPYDPALPWQWELAGRGGETSAVAVDERGFLWPAVTGTFDTVLLELELRSGKGEPSITARGGEVEIVQYIDRTARGRRYLDLSPFAGVLAAGERLELEGHRSRWAEGPALLHTFSNPPLDERRVLVLAPHPDDAEIAAYGVYSASDADVVTVTAGDAGGYNFRELWPEDRATHYEEKGEIRTWDSVTIPLLGGLGPGQARNLGFYDATLRTLWEQRPEPVPPPIARLEDPSVYRRMNLDAELRERELVPTWSGLVADLVRELERVRPAVVVAPSPDLDAHADHQFTTIALIEALTEYGDTAVDLYLYTNHPILAELAPWGSRDGVASLWPWRGPRLEFSRVHSVPLTPEQRKHKLIALEAMHDLRDFDLGEPIPFGRQTRALFSRMGRGISGKRRPDYSYFRRAARPNEMFLVLSVEQAVAMKKRFLENR